MFMRIKNDHLKSLSARPSAIHFNYFRFLSLRDFVKVNFFPIKKKTKAIYHHHQSNIFPVCQLAVCITNHNL